MPGLGRLVEHDPQSLGYPARKVAAPRSVVWPHTAPVLDQGDLGSCTGNALAQCLNTANFVRSRPYRRYLTERDAVDLYSLATTLDTEPGTYPPEDTGSSGLAVCKAAKQRGYLTRYDHAFGFDHFTAALSLQPVIVGTSWYDSMFTPDSRGQVHPAGQVAGGHEYLALGINYPKQLITFLNSWGEGWGKHGRFVMSFDDFRALLADQGDVTVPIGRT